MQGLSMPNLVSGSNPAQACRRNRRKGPCRQPAPKCHTRRIQLHTAERYHHRHQSLRRIPSSRYFLLRTLELSSAKRAKILSEEIIFSKA